MTPLQLSNLPVRTSAVSGDLMLLRSGFTDYKIDVDAIRAINLSVYGALPSAVATDLLLIQRASSTYSITFSQVGLLINTQCWFYQATAPINWQIVPNTGDRLLACATIAPATVVNYGNGIAGINAPPNTQGGTWQQLDAVLTIEQIPAHTHNIQGSSDNASSISTNFARYGKSDHAGSDITSRATGGAGSTNAQSATPIGATNGHNHGNQWRPAANVGIICRKVS